MAEPSLSEIMAQLKSLTAEMMTLKSDMAAIKDTSSSSGGNGAARRAEGLRDQDFHHKHKKWDFPASTVRPTQCSSSTNATPISTNT
jgi:hypothetical protein